MTDRARTVAASSPVVPSAVRARSSRLTIDVAAETHPGLIRPNNEDQFFVARLTRSLETMLSSLPAEDVPACQADVNYMMVIADGMGGHAAGEVASRLAISLSVNRVLDVPDWFFTLDERGIPIVEQRARELLQQAGSDIIERGRQQPALKGMGTTLTGVRNYCRDLLIVHVGDSRAYLQRGGQLLRLTKDHTYGQMLVDLGQLSPEEAARSRTRHQLTRALGGSTERVEVDVDLVCLEDGDAVLLCTDGLSDLVDDETIRHTVDDTRTSSEACTRLVKLALDAGGRDNITVVLARYTISNPT